MPENNATNTVFYFPNMPRNTAVDVHSFNQSFDTFWRGYVCTDVIVDNCLTSPPIRLVPNKYRIRFSALKHFGNFMNPNDFEVYVTPAFNLVY